MGDGDRVEDRLRTWSGYTGAVLRNAWLVGAVLVVLSACSPFAASDGSDGGAGGGGSCPAPTCEGAGPSCKSYDFAGPDCPADWELNGNFELGASASCKSGSLHVFADGTLDVFAGLRVTTPNAPYGARVSARVAVETWDRGTMLELSISGNTAVELRATTKPSGDPELVLCDKSGRCGPALESKQSKWHLLVVELRDTGVTATVDCAPFGSFSAVPLPLVEGLSLVLGKSAEPTIEGSLDDVTVSFF
jgi:hypothetical protein